MDALPQVALTPPSGGVEVVVVVVVVVTSGDDDDDGRCTPEAAVGRRTCRRRHCKSSGHAAMCSGLAGWRARGLRRRRRGSA